MRTTFKGKVVAIQPGQYTLYVFKNLDEPENSLLRYFTVTKAPNWCGVNPEIDDVGFVECEYVNAGDEYFQASTGNRETYNYTVCYFLHFIKEQPKLEVKEFNF